MFNLYGMKWPTSKEFVDTKRIVSELKVVIMALGVPTLLIVALGSGSKLKGYISLEGMLIISLFGLFLLFSAWSEDYPNFSCWSLFLISYGSCCFAINKVTLDIVTNNVTKFTFLACLVIVYVTAVFIMSVRVFKASRT